jgi:hypothetical protein
MYIYIYIMMLSSFLLLLGSCADFSAMTGTSATCAGGSICKITDGYLGISPGSSITGNFETDTNAHEVNNEFSNSCAGDGLNMWTAGMNLVGASLASEIGGITFFPGIYTTPGAVNIIVTAPLVYLDAEGDEDAKFVFTIAETLVTGAKSEVILLNGARAENVYWVVGTGVTIGADNAMVGTFITGTAVAMGSESTIVGRVISQTALTCDGNCGVGGI